MQSQAASSPAHAALQPPVPIVALDVATLAEACDLVARLPRADFFKVGLQLFTATGPEVVRWLKERDRRVFLDLKLHDIPNTVAGAVRAAAGLGVDLLTVHAAGGPAMLRAATAAAQRGAGGPLVFAVTVLTSLGPADLAALRPGEPVDVAAEAAHLARIADQAGVAGVVASVRDVPAIRGRTRPDLPVLTPGIRLPGDEAADQARIATPAEAAAAGVDYLVLGRSVTRSADPAAAYERALEGLRDVPAGSR